MKFKRLTIKDIIEITPNFLIDNRGYFSETYRKDLLEDFVGKRINFCQENQSKSIKNVFRGLHYQLPPNDQTKLVSVIKGKIIDVVVDLRVNSKSFKNLIKSHLDSCLSTEEELKTKKWKKGYNDDWPVERAYPN